MHSRSRRRGSLAPSVRWFVDERGSTVLAAGLAVVLAVTMVATGVQWYWVGSSSGDIQSVADMGALAGADAIAKTATVIQVLDFILLSMNVVALLLHAIVLVSGIATVAATPVGGTSMAVLFEKAIEFDRKFIDLRKKLANEIYRVATVVSDAAPVLAMGQSLQVVKSNSRVLKSFTGTEYVGTVIPFPLTGEVTLSSMPGNESDLADMVDEADGENTKDAAELEALEAELEAARVRCWEADEYRDPATPLYGWSPSSAIGDYERQLNRIGSSAPNVNLPAPVGETSWSEAVLRSAYESDYGEIGTNVASRFANLAHAGEGGYLAPGDAAPSYLLEQELTTEVYIVEHGGGERKAYHATRDCMGLSNASSEAVSNSLGGIVGDGDHPPCSLCTPIHWAAVQEWDTSLGKFTASWNQEAAAIREYESIRRQMEETRRELATRTEGAFETLMSNVSSFLKGGRLTYRPAGSRGLVCVVSATTTRRLPKFTLPALTGARGRVLGRQVALAGSAISAGGSGSAASASISKLSTDAGMGSTRGVSGAVMTTLGLSDGVIDALLPLWQGGVASLQGKPSSINRLFDALPWGLDVAAREFVQSIIDALGVSKPDLRQAIPVLVSVSEVGDPDEPAPEGTFASAVRGMRGAIGSAGHVADIANSLGEAGALLVEESDRKLLDVERINMFGKRIAVPFDEWSTMYGLQASSFAYSQLRAALGAP